MVARQTVRVKSPLGMSYKVAHRMVFSTVQAMALTGERPPVE
jgi:hypothetical protein